MHARSYLLTILFVVRSLAQTTQRATNDELIQLNFPDNVELKLLLDYVSERLGINIIYDDQQAAQRLTVRAPSAVPKNSLFNLLQSVVRQKGLMLLPADTAGWFKLVQINNLAAAAEPTTQPFKDGSSVVAQIFVLKQADPTKIDQVIRPFLSTPGGNTIALPEAKLLIVTDYADNVRRVKTLIDSLDQPSTPVIVDLVDVKNADPQNLATQVQQLVTSKAKAANNGGTAIEVQPDARTGRLVLIGTRVDVDEAKHLVEQLDTAVVAETATYQLRYVAPERIDKLARELANSSKRSYQSVVDRDAGLLIVTTGSPVHDQIQQLIKRLDITSESQEQSPIRFFKLYNTTAADVLQTLQAIEGEGGVAQIQVNAAAEPPPVSANPERPANPTLAGGLSSPLAAPLAAQTAEQPQPRSTLKTKDATVTSDPNTNTIIVVARPAIQHTYEEIIRNLDKRRPQVLIECTIVTLDTTNNFTFGVEISGRGGFGSYDVLSFSSFGLSKVNATNGQLALIPGLGFNGALLSSDVANVVVRALQSNARTEVLSAPKVLVNDHSTGILSSVDESPFTSTNASNTVSTTSFGGYASAGTTISVTPHISEADHLQLDYVVSLNSFTGSSGSGIPPPRQSNTLQSKVTIPDGSTIVVGGLNRRNQTVGKDALPILGEIPVLGSLFSSTANQQRTSTLFVFIRPIILRDDQFEDLKYFSAEDAKKAMLAGDDPPSEPVEMH